MSGERGRLPSSGAAGPAPVASAAPRVLDHPRPRAVIVLAVLVLVWAVGATYTDAVRPPPITDEVSDVATYIATIERLRAGEPYYAAVGAELRRGGYPTWPVANWRTPLHYRTVALLGFKASGWLLTALALAAVVLGAFRWRHRPIRAALVAVLLFGALLVAIVNGPGSAVVMPETWCGVLMALSLGAYLSELWLVGALFGIAAVFLRELAAPYVLISGLLAMADRRKGESVLFVCGGLAYAAYYLIHAAHAASAVQAGDVVNTVSWIQWQGLPFILKTLHEYGWLLILPDGATPVAAAVGLSCLADWRTLPRHFSIPFAVYAIAFGIVGQRFDYYWGLVTTPLWGFAFVHAVDALPALLANAFGKPRRPPDTPASQQS